ncbi:MAG: sigma-54-dependent Fis family transcriptional regulator [Deltaproteobacteria bacterium]|nr:sigma-54-dependent Fis family transcriptional regulator [Deltaproteobacteria bacterium]
MKTMEMQKLAWDRLEKLRAPQSLSSALNHLGIKNIKLIRKELREDGTLPWINIPLWLKGEDLFIQRMHKNEIGAELLRVLSQEVQDEAYRLQETVYKISQLGVSEVAVPLVLRGERIGFLNVGGFILEDLRPGDVGLEEKFKVLMLPDSEISQAIIEWRQLPQFNSDKRAIVIQMIELLAREVISFFEETLSAQEREEAVTKHTFSQMVTAHPPLKNILKKLPSLAVSDASILIYGEPGTGRELFAKLLHDESPRAKKAFKTLHCSSISENLIEAELLGYEKGAFAGAYHTKVGLFETCAGGSLYLEEIGDLSISMQHKILRFIQDKSFSRLGSPELMKSDVRLIASTQRNLKKLVQVGAFREELLIRLNSQEIELPPLRQRKEDIPLLAEHFLKLFMKSMNKEGIQWTDEALGKLSAHSFPGNARELRNEIERLAAIKRSHELIQATDLSPKITEMRSPVEEIEKGMTLKNIVDDYEKQIISDALQKYHWNKSKVAELFQITRQGLLKKIGKYKLDKRKAIR